MLQEKAHTAQMAPVSKRLIMLIIIFMALGTGIELTLLKHYEDIWQLVPLLLLSAALVVFIFTLFKPTSVIRNIFIIILSACIISGFVGAGKHLNANMEFALELNPSAKGWPLIVKSFTGAFPALAPGSMIVFGLIGYLYTTLILKKQ